MHQIPFLLQLFPFIDFEIFFSIIKHILLLNIALKNSNNEKICGRENLFMEKQTGYIHIYCGDGKGKTTAATGLAVRAAGSGMKVLFARFLKNENSAELCVLDQIPGIEVIHLPKSYGFYNTQSEEEKAETKQMYEELWKYALDRAKNGACDMLVMDEFMAADRYGLIPHEEAIQFLKEKPEGLEVVLTGRDPSEDLIRIADYVSEIRKVKHPFDCGVYARRGIEY